MAEEDPKGPGSPISLSFSGSGFLINYQVGVVQALRELAPEIMRSASKVYGASCGSVVAAAVVCDIDVGLIKEFFHEAMEEVRKVSKLNVCPGYRPLRIIEKGLSQKLPENSHQLASGKLCISVTRLLDLQNVIISEYRSKEELIQAVICSCFLPVYCGFNPPSFQGMRYIDGGISNVQPGSDSETMITVSPYTGEVDICPRDCPAYFNCISFFQSTFQLSVENVCRFSYSIFPPSPPVLHEFYLQGYHDAIFFLQRHRENGTVNGTDKKIPQQTPVHCDKAVALPALKSQETPGSLGSAAEITSPHLVPCKLRMNTSLSLTDR
ncbi:patatin like phospholipase domain containing 1 [Chelydra serpentina]|uniref:triacylglycerol lipase n=1 Tax=Chelydra serpentina TaxID=8475 RepID=A0A8T1T1J4_CHESE|nr:patatin like phospholipase domain containing 1 [Chelydra serpentina]